jgi:hypothetical protein
MAIAAAKVAVMASRRVTATVVVAWGASMDARDTAER